MEEHYCNSVETFPLDKFFQTGTGIGASVLIVGESPAPNGWRLSGKACYSPTGKLLPTGARLNEYLSRLNLSVETCGFTELVKCYLGPNRTKLQSCANKCWPIFLRQLSRHTPKLIIILGVKTTQIINQITNLNLHVGQLEVRALENRSYNFLSLFHPSPVNPTGHTKNKQIVDILSEKITSLL